MSNMDKIFKILELNSKRGMQNQSAIRSFLELSIKTRKLITFYNWECPPRFLDNGRINYLVDLEKIFRGQKIDKFTELPRVVAQRRREIRILNLLNSLGLQYQFVKLIADTNAYYLTPDSLLQLGEETVRTSFRKFKQKIQERIELYPANSKVYLFTELLGQYRNLYTQSYQEALRLLRAQKLLSKDILLKQFKRTREHVGISGQKNVEEFSLKTIATYAAEGMAFDKLSQASRLLNCVWLNIEEVDTRTIAITNCLRRRKGIDPLPMWFPK